MERCVCVLVTSVVSDSVQSHPWDSPGKNTGVGCHFLLQCINVKSESEVFQSCPTHHDPMDCSLLGSSVHGIFQARVLEWGAIAFSLSGDWLTGEERGDLQGNTQEPPTGNFPEDKGSQQHSWVLVGEECSGTEGRQGWSTSGPAGRHREFLWPCVCDFMSLQGSRPTRMSSQRTS